MYGIILIVILIIIGGFTAFIGDRIGSKVGKKRMSLFGLRPRHTSIIVTIVTGVLITTITFLILSITSKNVRTALFGMEKLQEQMKTTQKELSLADEALKKAHEDQDKTKKLLDKSHKELLVAKENTEKLKIEQLKLSELNKKLDSENSHLSSVNSNLHILNDKLNTTNEKLQIRNSKLQIENDDLLKRNGDLSSKKIIYQAGELIFAATVAPTKNRNEAQDELSKLIAVANNKVQAVAGNNTITGKDGIWIYPNDYEDAVNKICLTDKDMVIRFLATANIVQGEPVRTNIELYPNYTVYNPNQMILQEAFALDGTQAKAQEAVFAFLENVNKTAAKNGILPDPLHGSIGIINMDQLYNVIDAMAPIKGDVLVTAYSRGKTDVLGPLHLILKVEQLHEKE